MWLTFNFRKNKVISSVTLSIILISLIDFDYSTKSLTPMFRTSYLFANKISGKFYELFILWMEQFLSGNALTFHMNAWLNRCLWPLCHYLCSIKGTHLNSIMDYITHKDSSKMKCFDYINAFKQTVECLHWV